MKRSLLLAAAVTGMGCAGDRESWTSTGGPFQVRATRTLAWPGWLASEYRCRIESRPHGGEWLVVADVADDEGVCMDDVRFVSATMAFGHHGSLYVVTTDGGVTWDSWNGAAQPWACSSCFRYVEGIDIGADGHGIMLADIISEEVPFRTGRLLRTTDHGRTWRLESGLYPRPCDGGKFPPEREWTGPAPTR